MVHDSRIMSTIDGDHVRVVIAPIDETRFTGSGSDQHLHHNLLSRLKAVFEAVHNDTTGQRLSCSVGAVQSCSYLECNLQQHAQDQGAAV